MKKTLFFGLMATALGLTACSDTSETIFNESAQKGMTLNATVVESVDTRANIDNSESVWPFTFSPGDVVMVTNGLESTSYSFTKDATSFTCIEATPTDEATTWYAHYPSGDIDLTDQEGTLDYVASIYALSGATTSPTTGESGLTINLTSSMSVIKIINGGGSIDIRIKKSVSEWVKGLTQTTDGFEVTTSTEAVSIFQTSTAGEYYIAVPSGLPLVIKDGDVHLEGCESGYAAGKYYSVRVNEALWSESLPYESDYLAATKAVIETNISSSLKPTSATNLNAVGDVWCYLDGSTIRVQSPRPKIYLKGALPASYLFWNFGSLTEITGLGYLDTSAVTKMSQMFGFCSSLASLDVSGFNTSKVTDMNAMFDGCTSLQTLDLSNFDTSAVTSMYHMFNLCKSLTSLNVSSFNTSKVTTMYCMFYGCESLTSLNVSNFNTSKVTSMQQMFHECKSLTSLDASGFSTESLTTVSSMFTDCYKMESLKLSDNFKVNNVPNINNMFGKCGRDVTDMGVIYNITDADIKAACKNDPGSVASLDYSGWTDAGTKLKFDGE